MVPANADVGSTHVLRVSCSAAVSMAVLQVNSDQHGVDLIGQFLPFVVEVLREQTPPGIPQPIETPVLQAAIKDSFSLHIPAAAMKTLLNRAVDKGYATRKNGCFYPVVSKLETSTLRSTRATVVREHEALIAAFCAHAAGVLSLAVDAADAERALDAYLTRAMVPLLSSVVEGASLRETESRDSLSSIDVALEAFIIHVSRTDPTLFGYLGSVVKGSMLASALYFPDLGRASASFKGTNFYLDTRILLHALGHAGAPAREAAVEFLALLREAGGRLYCFEHTVREVEGVLEAARAVIADPRKHRDASGETVMYLLDTGTAASEVVRFIAQARGGLDALSIVVKATPPHVEGLGCDEISLEEMLHTSRPGGRSEAIVNDIASLTAIHRLRSGAQTRQLESTRAVFVTTNMSLVNVARKAFSEQYPFGTIPVAFAANDLAALAWIKKPGMAPNLPTKILIADCYAALNPRDETWLAYLKRIRELRSTEEITDEGYMLLRADLQVRALLAIRQVEDGVAYADGDLVELARKAEQHIGMELRAELADSEAEREREREARELAEQEAERLADELDQHSSGSAEAMRAANERHDARIAAIAGSIASGVIVLLALLMLGLAILGALATFPATSSWFAHGPVLLRQAIGGVCLLSLLAGCADLVGIGPSRLWPRVRTRLERVVSQFLRRAFPVPHPELGQ